jgi:hypothetical protein
MKRILLIAILVFPVVSLAVWLYWGSQSGQATPHQPFQTNVSSFKTNLSISSPSK